MTRRRFWLVVVLALAVLAALAVFLLNGPLACGTAQTWTLEHGCWPGPAAY
jgi:hypothetical protein